MKTRPSVGLLTALVSLVHPGCTASLSDTTVALPAQPPAAAIIAGPEPEKEEESEAYWASLEAGIVALDPRPAQRYRPGDFEPPNALVVAYEADWSEALVELINSAREEVDVYILASQAELEDYRFFAWLARHDADVVFSSHDTPWVRDFGPMQVFDAAGRVVWLDFRYSEDRAEDDSTPSDLAAQLGMPLEKHDWWLDGGALLSNGKGLCAITDVSVGTLGIPGEDSAQYDRFLRAVGCQVLAVIPALPAEETGHADVIAQFLDEGILAIGAVGPGESPRASDALEEAASIIRDAALVIGQDLDIVRLPMHVRGRVYYSYANVTRLPGQLLVPRYRASRDLEAAAYEELSRALPGVRLVPIAADAMVERGGAVHCVTLGLNVPDRDLRVARAPRRWLGTSRAPR